MLRQAITALLVLALPVSAAPDAGELPPAVYAERAQLLIPGGNWVESVCYPIGDGGTACGGAWLPDSRAVAVARELERDRAETQALESKPPETPQGYLVALGLGLALGVTAGAVAVCAATTGSPVCWPAR